MTEKEEILISEPRTVAEIKAIQKYIKSKGERTTKEEIVQACIRVAKRLSAENWGIYLEVKDMHKKNE